MHELSLAASVMEIVLRHAAGRKVTKVTLEVGALKQAVPSALTFSFEMMAQGTNAEGALVAIKNIPTVGKCRKCGQLSQQPDFPLVCRVCGAFDLEIIAGEELTVAGLEVEDRIDGDSN